MSIIYVHRTARLATSDIERIDQHVARLRAERPGVRVTWSDALRDLIGAGDRAERTREHRASEAREG